MVVPPAPTVLASVVANQTLPFGAPVAAAPAYNAVCVEIADTIVFAANGLAATLPLIAWKYPLLHTTLVQLAPIGNGALLHNGTTPCELVLDAPIAVVDPSAILFTYAL